MTRTNPQFHRLLLATSVLLALLLNSCAPKEAEVETASATPPKVTTPKKEQDKSALKTDGKYYKDDGPPAEDEVDWRTVPDPEVAFAPIKEGYNRPYEVFGTRYVPYANYVAYRQRGMASWYGRRYHGRKTSSGEVYDMYAMSAAHTILPIPSYARVTRVDDGRSIIVRVNDRGPFLNERVIDLSYTAARKLGVVAQGTAEVIVEAIIPEHAIAVAAEPKAKEEPTSAAAQGTATALPANAGNFLQLGAFSSADNATNFAGKLALPTTLTIAQPHVRLEDGLHRVVIGPYSDRALAEDDLSRLQDAGLEALLRVFK